MDTNKKAETKSSSIDDIDKKIHANQVLYDQLHQSLVDEVVSKDDEAQKKEKSKKSDVSKTRNFLLKFSDYYKNHKRFMNPIDHKEIDQIFKAQ